MINVTFFSDVLKKMETIKDDTLLLAAYMDTISDEDLTLALVTELRTHGMDDDDINAVCNFVYALMVKTGNDQQKAASHLIHNAMLQTLAPDQVEAVMHAVREIADHVKSVRDRNVSNKNIDICEN